MLKYIIGSVVILFALYGFIAWRRRVNTPTTAIPNNVADFYTAVGNGNITFKLTSDPFGIYDKAGDKIGYWVTDGSVFDMNNNLIVKGFNGLKKK